MATPQTTTDSIKRYYGAGNTLPPVFPVIFTKIRLDVSRLNKCVDFF